MIRWGMVIDLQRCIGCYSCQISCKMEHFLPPNIFWNRVLIGEKGKYPSVTKIIMPTICNHCTDAACVEVCPTGATQIRDDGIVHIDYDQCVGCRSCLIACPYQTVFCEIPEPHRSRLNIAHSEFFLFLGPLPFSFSLICMTKALTFSFPIFASITQCIHKFSATTSWPLVELNQLFHITSFLMSVQLTRYEMDLTQSRVKAQVLFSDIGFFFQPVQNGFLGVQSLSA